ncbi:MAG: VCBS repeat-containing protein, partial [Gammaproteobacteria bacterium]|nr:VCBS repeat-containing protein [Gammaproteobacteria bacterium]
AVGFDITAHGLFSHDDDGDWLSFSWDLVAKPLTSTVTLPNSNDAAITIVPDVDGDYLLRLRVTDGQQTSETHVRMRVDDFGAGPTETRTMTGGLEVARPFIAGVPFLVDGYSSANRPYVPGFESWFASGPGNAALTDLGKTYQRELTVDTNGLWEVTFDESTGAAGYLNSFGFARFAVGPDIFENPIEFVDSVQAVDIIDADYDGDGQTDLILRVLGLNVLGVQVLIADGNGSFTASPVLDTPDGELAVGDLNGDGRLDIAVSSDDAIYLSYQQSDSSPAEFVPEPIPDIGCTLTGSERDIGIGDIDGDSRDDLITLAACDGELIVWRQNAAGSLDAPTVQSLGERARIANFVDVNNDGRMDALLGVWENGALPVGGVVALAQPDGSFVAIERFPAFGSPAPTLTAGDINSDGLTDIVMLDMNNFSVFERQTNGTYVETVSNFDMGDFVGFEAATKVLDIDGDGDTDVVACKSVRDLYVGYQTTSNNFEFYKVGDCANLMPTLPNGFAVMDFNNDGVMDILSTSEKSRAGATDRRVLFELFLGGTSTYARPVAP